MASVKTFADEVRQMLAPGRNGRYGVLPPLLVGMTMVTGLVDSFSYLTLGHVFVANMTGNVVFLGFALVGVGGFSIAASLVALGAFAVGAFCAGVLGSKFGAESARLLRAGASLQTLCLAVSVVLSAVSGTSGSAAYGYVLIALLGLAMGLQNGLARQLAIPDLTTTVLTMTITGIAADTRWAGGDGSKAGRRLVAIVAMLTGALVGAALILHVQAVYSLVIALVLTAVIAALTRIPSTIDPAG